MSNQPDLDRLEEIIGVEFGDRRLLIEALTHPSAGEEKNYQRLEFLGDRVLGLVIANFLIVNFPGENEGNLARRFSGLVDRTMLARVAAEAELVSFIVMSGAEEVSGGYANENIIADVMEAVIGAAFLDVGFEGCREMVRRLWNDFLFEMIDPPVDSKTALQEWTQARGLGLPDYALVDREGPDHAPVFDVKVTVEGYSSVTAKGTSRRMAEKKAAEKMLEELHSGRKSR